MKTSLKAGFAQIFSLAAQRIWVAQNFGGAAAPLAPPGPYTYDYISNNRTKNYKPVYSKQNNKNIYTSSIKI